MLSHSCDFSVFKMHNKESSDPPVAARSIYKYVPRITRSWVCALYAAGVIRTTSQTVICYFIRHQGAGAAFHLPAAAIFDANQIVFNVSLHLNILLKTAVSSNFRTIKERSDLVLLGVIK